MAFIAGLALLGRTRRRSISSGLQPNAVSQVHARKKTS